MPAAKRRDLRASEARERLLEATLRCAIRDGGGALSLQSIAAEAGVSKALVLYHYHGKERLLAITIRWLATRLLAREANALARSSASSALEDYWRWMASEIERGEARVLIELSQERGAEVREAIDETSLARQQQAEQTVSRVFQLLELTPRVPVAMIASGELAFRDGLVLWAWRQPDRSARVAFDVCWLSLLSLAR